MQKSINLQDVFLNKARKERVFLQVFLTNGFQLKGTVLGFDNFVVVLECEGKQNMVYKHAISTIIPSKEIPVLNENRIE
ncbi:MAG: RNA chaperone Hfq [Oscillospiraceae bacterium]|nr:RNA chaperone Hfq [Oscillospiraceae bacterium]